ncbi:E3 ubiquitin-protein ligase TRIM71-like [Mya arenaria]|uniref:E3 ubiquitin-protein ligase TRIM71-like n=1 Tax=Mya arenaria TaxID=6604 RepID=UPI0022E66E5D|nr:E3 ubiquitin-protein ligase TRIM71-like [Mya arenaria]
MAENGGKVAETSDNADSVGGKAFGVTVDRVKLCDPCFEEGTEVLAAKFCVECEENLCDICVQHHRKAKPCKNHELVDTGALGQGSKEKERNADVFKCTIHQEEITHYCDKHGKLCCPKCVRGIHTMCGDSVCKVDEAAEKIEESRIFKEFVDKLHHLLVDAQGNEKRATAKIETGMEQFQRQIESARKMADEEVGRIKTIASSMDSITEELTIDEKTGSMFLIGKEPFGLREVTKDGEVKTIALSKPIEEAGGIVLESDGTFLVSSEHNMSIKRVTVEGSVEDFITGLEFSPHGLGFDKQRRLLYVGGIDSNVILMYSI